MRLVLLMIGLVLAAPAWAQLENITDREAILDVLHAKREVTIAAGHQPHELGAVRPGLDQPALRRFGGLCERNRPGKGGHAQYRNCSLVESHSRPFPHVQ